MTFSRKVNENLLKVAIAKGAGVSFDHVYDFQVTEVQDGSRRLQGGPRRLAASYDVKYSLIVPEDMAVEELALNVAQMAEPGSPAHTAMADNLRTNANIEVHKVAVQEAPSITTGVAIVKTANGEILRPIPVMASPQAQTNKVAASVPPWALMTFMLLAWKAST